MRSVDVAILPSPEARIHGSGVSQPGAGPPNPGYDKWMVMGTSGLDRLRPLDYGRSPSGVARKRQSGIWQTLAADGRVASRRRRTS